MRSIGAATAVTISACAVAFVAAPGSSVAQAPSAGDKGSPPTIELLFNNAKASLADVPRDIAVSYLLQIGRAESWRSTDAVGLHAGVEDMSRAFDQALQLSDDESSLGSSGRHRVKSRTEELAIELIAVFDPQQALTLTRRADIDRGRLYDELLYSVAARARLEHAHPGFDPAAVVRESEANGAFPYRGVTQLILNSNVTDAQRRALAAFELHYAAQETPADHDSLLNAPQALISLHEVVPDLDVQTADAAVNILGLLHRFSSGTTMAAGGARMQGTFLLTSLKQFDASRAAELALEYPEFLAATKDTATGQALGSEMHAQQLAAADVLPSPPDANASALARFAAYTQRASVLAKKDPVQALEDALRAESLANADLIAQPGMPLRAIQLAGTLKLLGATRNSYDLLGRALDTLADSDAEREKQFREGDSQAVQRFIQEQSGAFSSASWQALVAADKVDFETTARHALAWPAPITRVAALIAAAWGDSPQPSSMRPSRY